MPVSKLSDIRIGADVLSEATLSSSQVLDSPTSPRPPRCEVGWRDRWWLQGQPSRSVAIHYWIFSSRDEAHEAAEVGRERLSSRRVLIEGTWQPIYQPLEAPPCGEACWQALHNILFVRGNVLILVAESGRQVPLGTMLTIATKIDSQIAQYL